MLIDRRAVYKNEYLQSRKCILESARPVWINKWTKKETMSNEYEKTMAKETGTMTNTTIHNTFTKIRRVPVVLN